MANACTTRIVSENKPIENANLKVGKFHFINTDKEKFYGKIDSISTDKIYLSDKKNNKFEIKKSEVKTIKKYSVGKSIAAPILIYGGVALTGLILIMVSLTKS